MHRLAMNITGATVLYFSRPCCPRRAASLAASLVGSPASTGPTRGPFRNNPPEAAARHIYGAGGYVHREAGKQQHTHDDQGGGRQEHAANMHSQMHGYIQHTTRIDVRVWTEQHTCITLRCSTASGFTRLRLRLLRVSHWHLQGTRDTPWALRRGMLTFRRTTINSDRAKINVSPVLIGFFFSGVNLR